LEAIIIRYGVIAIFLGAAIEGEPFAIAGGILAHRHWLPAWLAALAAIAGALSIDQIWFHLSRHFRHNRRIEKVSRRPAFARSLDLLDRRPIWFLALFRFAYGVRAVAPVAIGLSRVPARLFVALDIPAAIVWGSAFTALGFALGPAFEAAEARYGTTIEVGAIAVSVLALVFALHRGSKRG